MIDRDALIAILSDYLERYGDRFDEAVGRILALEPAARTWAGEARAAFDQALANAPKDAAFGEAGFWLQRAQIAATLAGVEQARLANLIAWKQFQAMRLAAADQGAGMLPLGGADTIVFGPGEPEQAHVTDETAPSGLIGPAAEAYRAVLAALT